MKSTVLLIFGLISGIAAAAQAVAPVEWSAQVVMDSGTHGHVALTADIGDGWHLYSNELPDGGPNPTCFIFDTTPGVRLNGGVITDAIEAEGIDMIFHLRLSWWEKQVSFIQYFEIVNDKANNIDVSVTYQASNGTSCIAPTRRSFELAIAPMHVPGLNADGQTDEYSAPRPSYKADKSAHKSPAEDTRPSDDGVTPVKVGIENISTILSSCGFVRSIIITLLLIAGMYLLGLIKLRCDTQSNGISLKRLAAGLIVIAIAIYIFDMRHDRCDNSCRDKNLIENEQ